MSVEHILANVFFMGEFLQLCEFFLMKKICDLQGMFLVVF
jgi:hypothetical protein